MDEDRYYNLGSHDKLFNQIDELTDALASRDAEIESLRQQLEIERMRNVACDVVAMADTPTSAEEARKMLPDYRSAALESVIRRVDECIALRQQLADKQAIIDDWLYDNGPNGWIESLRQRLAGANARIELMGETALNQQKREVMLLDALEYYQAQTRPIQRTEEALAAT